MAKRCLGCMKLKEQSPVCEHCGYNENVPNYAHQLPLGTVLHGQYTVGKVLGQGGFGITYIGWDNSLDAPVAIKEFYPNSIVTRECGLSRDVHCAGKGAEALFYHNRERFLKEAKILAKLQNVPGIVRVQNLFEENNTAYIVMEYVEGIDLKHYIRGRNRLLTVEEAFAVLRPVMYALSKVHEAELVHRDISPDNIMIQTDGTAKLLDFGAAREVADAGVDKELPQSTEAILKHGFAPIEQYRRRGSLGPWTDVYALCATMYYCMTGKVPNSAPERIMGDDNVNWRQIPGLSEQQIQALEKGLALMPENRIRTMRELHNGLFGQNTTSFTQVKKEEPKPEPSRRGGAPALPKAAAKEQKKKKPIGLMAAALAVVAAVGIFALKPKDTPGSTSAPEEKPSISATEPVIVVTLSEEEKQYLAAEELEVAGEYGKAAIAFGKLGDFKDARQRSFGLWDTVTSRKTLAADMIYTAAITEEGTVVADGCSEEVQKEVARWKDIIAVGIGRNHIVGLKADGTVVAAGSNEFGQCDVTDWTDIVAISADEAHTVGLKSDGTVVAVGSNEHYGRNTHRCDVSRWTDIIAISTGQWNTVGLRTDGTVVVAGYGAWDQKDVADWTDIVSVSAASLHVVGLKSDGTVVAEGENKFMQCHVSNWADIVAVSAGERHTLGLKSDGTVVAAGSNKDNIGSHAGQCDVSGWKDVVAIDAGSVHSVALKSDGTVEGKGPWHISLDQARSWTDIRVPSQTEAPPAPTLPQDINVADGDQAAAYAAAEALEEAGEYGKAAIAFGKLGDYSDAWERSNTLWAQILERQTVILTGYGNNYVAYGVKADGTMRTAETREPGYLTPFDLSGWSDIVCIDGDGYAVVGLRSDGRVLCATRSEEYTIDTSAWTDVVAIYYYGPYVIGLKADGTLVTTGSEIYGLSEAADWTDIVGIYTTYSHIIGLKADGTVVVTGNSNYSQTDVADWTDIVMLRCDQSDVLGLKADGTMVAAGFNRDGLCDVSDWTDIVDFGFGTLGYDVGRFSVGLKADGTVVTAGCNGKNWHLDPLAQWADIQKIVVCDFHIFGLRSDGTVVAGGREFYNNFAVSDWNDIVQLTAEQGITRALKADGTVLTIGDNSEGQLNTNEWHDIIEPIGMDYCFQSDGTVVTADNRYKDLIHGWTDMKLPISQSLQPEAPTQETVVEPSAEIDADLKAGITSGEPTGKEWYVTFEPSGQITVHSIKYQLLDNGYRRYTVEFTTKAGKEIVVFNPPNGSLYSYPMEGKTSGEKQTMVFDVKESDFIEARECTIKFFNNKVNDTGYIFLRP